MFGILFGTGCAANQTEVGQTTQWIDLVEDDGLAHWRGYQQEQVPPSWEVRDGSIFCNGQDDAHLVTRRTYGDFELTGEWKISRGGNSGILLRVVEVTPWPASSGLEVQVIDHPDGWSEVHGYEIGMGQAAGAIYGLYPAREEAIKPTGEWNSFRIRMQGSTIQVWQNGVMLVDADMTSEDWQERLGQSKFAESEHFNRASTGHIALQNYRGAGVWYRHLCIREIQPTEQGHDEE